MKPYYEDAQITIYHGDCREILPDLPPVDLVLTDPPYAIGSGKNEWKVTASVGTGLHFAARKVKKKGAMLVLGTTSGRGMDFTFGAIGDALPFNRMLAWHKQEQRSRVAGPWRWDLVCILAFGRACFGTADRSSLYQSTSSGDAEVDHPSAVPIGLARWLYEPFYTTAEVILDPFMGSGSLLLPAAEDDGEKRQPRVIGVELEERHCELAVQRFAQSSMEVAA